MKEGKAETGLSWKAKYCNIVLVNYSIFVNAFRYFCGNSHHEQMPSTIPKQVFCSKVS